MDRPQNPPITRICQYPVPTNRDGICGLPLSGRGRWKYCREHAPLARKLFQPDSKTYVSAWRDRWPMADFIRDYARVVGATVFRSYPDSCLRQLTVWHVEICLVLCSLRSPTLIEDGPKSYVLNRGRFLAQLASCSPLSEGSHEGPPALRVTETLVKVYVEKRIPSLHREGRLREVLGVFPECVTGGYIRNFFDNLTQAGCSMPRICNAMWELVERTHGALIGTVEHLFGFGFPLDYLRLLGLPGFLAHRTFPMAKPHHEEPEPDMRRISPTTTVRIKRLKILLHCNLEKGFGWEMIQQYLDQ